MTAWTPHHLLPHITLPPTGYRPPRGRIDVWTLHADPDSTSRTQQLKALLDATERRRANSFLSLDRRDTYVLAHLALRLILANCLDTDPRRVTISRAPCPACHRPHGRPTLGLPNLHFSLSRARSTVVIALAQTPVGIDLEVVDRVEGALLNKLHPDERETIRQLPPTHRSHALLECWVRKEAYLKGQGTGIAAGRLRNVDIGPGPRFTDRADTLTGWSLTSLTAPPGYAAATALSMTGHPGLSRSTIAYHGCDQCRRPTPAVSGGVLMR